MKYKILLGILLTVVLGFWLFRDSGVSSYARVSFSENQTFYAPIRIEKFTSGKIPCIDVEIEGQKLAFRLDLGFNEPSSMQKHILRALQQKTYLSKHFSCGVQGNIYPVDVYALPPLKIGGHIFTNMTVSEEVDKLNEEKIILPQENAFEIAGKIGWPLFRQSALLLDLGKSTLALCDSKETFLKLGYSLDRFTKVVFSDHPQLIEFDISSSRGPLHCILDSGCTFNFLNRSKLKDESLETIIKKNKKFQKVRSFKISGKEFGPLEFFKMPISLPIHVDAILGMEFLETHVVFIDFINRVIYFK